MLVTLGTGVAARHLGWIIIQSIVLSVKYYKRPCKDVRKDICCFHDRHAVREHMNISVPESGITRDGMIDLELSNIYLLPSNNASIEEMYPISLSSRSLLAA